MTTTEEKVAQIEGRVLEQSQMFTAIRQDIADLGRRMETQFYWLLGVQMTVVVVVIAALLKH